MSSSRQIERACLERIDFRYLAGGRQPDHRTIAAFRKRFLNELGNLFPQVLQIAIDDELVDLREVAFDGTKVLANASKHKAMSYEYMKTKSKLLRKEIAELKKERRAARGKKKKDLDAEITFKKSRLSRICEAKKGLELQIEEEHGRKPQPKEQRNFTDSESRIMKVGAALSSATTLRQP